MAVLGRRRLPTLAGARVELRWLVNRDAPALFEVFSDPEVARYWSSLPMTRLEEARQLVREIREEHRDGRLHEWGVVRRDEERVIGTCALFNIDPDNRRAEIGFALGRAWWGQGLMSDALTVLIEFCFDQLALRRLEADADPRNSVSIRLLERLGFKQEGLLRERWNTGGELQDTAFFGLLAREFRPARR